MARPKKDGRRATGIQGKKGYLYIVTSQPVIRDGAKKIEKRWIATGLTDTPENVKKASDSRSKLLGNKSIPVTDSNITLPDYTDYILSKKKREVSETTYSAYFYRANRIKEYFSDIKVKDVNEAMVESFLDGLFEIQHVQPRTVKDGIQFIIAFKQRTPIRPLRSDEFRLDHIQL